MQVVLQTGGFVSGDPEVGECFGGGGEVLGDGCGEFGREVGGAEAFAAKGMGCGQREEASAEGDFVDGELEEGVFGSMGTDAADEGGDFEDAVLELVRDFVDAVGVFPRLEPDGGMNVEVVEVAVFASGGFDEEEVEVVVVAVGGGGVHKADGARDFALFSTQVLGVIAFGEGVVGGSGGVPCMGPAVGEGEQGVAEKVAVAAVSPVGVQHSIGVVPQGLLGETADVAEHAIEGGAVPKPAACAGAGHSRETGLGELVGLGNAGVG